jgi:hypothetical protein
MYRNVPKEQKNYGMGILYYTWKETKKLTIKILVMLVLACHASQRCHSYSVILMMSVIMHPVMIRVIGFQLVQHFQWCLLLKVKLNNTFQDVVYVKPLQMLLQYIHNLFKFQIAQQDGIHYGLDIHLQCTLVQVQKVVDNHYLHPVLAWKISVQHLSLNVMVQEEPVITLQINSAFGLQLLMITNNSRYHNPKQSKLVTQDQEFLGAKFVLKIAVSEISA